MITACTWSLRLLREGWWSQCAPVPRDCYQAWWSHRVPISWNCYVKDFDHLCNCPLKLFSLFSWSDKIIDSRAVYRRRSGKRLIIRMWLASAYALEDWSFFRNQGTITMELRCRGISAVLSMSHSLDHGLHWANSCVMQELVALSWVRSVHFHWHERD